MHCWLHWTLWHASDHKKATHGFDFAGRLCDVHPETNGKFVHWCTKDGLTNWALPICTLKCPKIGDPVMCPDRNRTIVTVEVVDGEQVCRRHQKFEKVLTSVNTYPAYRYCFPEETGRWLLTIFQIRHDEVMSTLSAALVLLKSPPFWLTVPWLTIKFTKRFISKLASDPDFVIKMLCWFVVAALNLIGAGCMWRAWASPTNYESMFYVSGSSAAVLLCALSAVLTSCYAAVTLICDEHCLKQLSNNLREDSKGMRDVCDLTHKNIFVAAFSLFLVVIQQVVLALSLILIVPTLLSTCEVQAEEISLNEGSSMKGLNRHFICSTTSLLVSPLVVMYMFYFYFWLSRLTDAICAFMLAQFYLDERFDGKSWRCLWNSFALLCVGAFVDTFLSINHIPLFILQKMSTRFKWNFDSTIYAIIASKQPQSFSEAWEEHRRSSHSSSDQQRYINLISGMAGIVVALAMGMLAALSMLTYMNGPELLEELWQAMSRVVEPMLFEFRNKIIKDVHSLLAKYGGVDFPLDIDFWHIFRKNVWLIAEQYGLDKIIEVLGLAEASEVPVPVFAVTVIVLSFLVGFIFSRIVAASADIKRYVTCVQEGELLNWSVVVQ